MKSDIVFVLDISHSITDKDLSKVVDFETKFIQRLTIGPDSNRVGTVLFGRHAHNAFTLTSNQDKNETLAAVREIHNLTQDIKKSEVTLPSNIAAGLCNMWTMFKLDGRSLDTVFRMAIVLSDGIVHDYPQYIDCDWRSTDEAIEEIRSLRPPILVYVIDTSNVVDDAKLRKIATDGNHYAHIDDFNEESFQNISENVVSDLCWKG